MIHEGNGEGGTTWISGLRGRRLARGIALWAVAAAIALAGTGPSALRGAEVRIGPRTLARFAELRQGIEAITRRDDYIKQMSRFDRQARLRTNRTVSEAELLAFISQHVQPWRPEEITRLSGRLELLAKKLAPWKLRLPEVVLLVKTDGDEEGVRGLLSRPGDRAAAADGQRPP